MPPTSLRAVTSPAFVQPRTRPLWRPGNAADVITRVGVSHVAVVVAVLDNGGIQPGDTAEIRDINDGFLIQSERGNIKRFFLVRLLDCDIIRINGSCGFRTR